MIRTKGRSRLILLGAGMGDMAGMGMGRCGVSEKQIQGGGRAIRRRVGLIGALECIIAVNFCNSL
jgi:hypothetical protein